MKIHELEKIMLSKDVPKHLYSLKGGLPNEAYCIEKEDDGWHVYYSERGIKTSIGFFDYEEKACDCFYEEIEKIISIK